jgi:hypothetical protein
MEDGNRFVEFLEWESEIPRIMRREGKVFTFRDLKNYTF